MEQVKNYVLKKAQEIFGKYEFRNHLKFLKEAQYYSKEKIQEIQLNKLKKLVKQASNTKFYSHYFKEKGLDPTDITSLDDLKLFPVMTKAKYREIFPEDIMNPKSPPKDFYLNSTSGSTGSPFKFYMTKRHRGYTAARVLSFYKWAGRDYNESILRLWGAPNLDLKTKLFQKIIENVTLIDAFDLNQNNFEEHFEEIKEKDFSLLESYTSAAYEFALLLKNNEKNLHIPSAILSGETLYDYQMQLIENRFNTEIYNRYGCREFGALAQECSEHNGLHIAETDFIIEIVNDQNEVLSEGEKGNIIVTCLDNYSMPFIRYQIDDIGSLSKEICPCGRELTKLEFVEGRVSDMLYAPSGRHISLYYFALLFQGRSDYVHEFQVNQREDNLDIVLKLVTTPKYNKKIEKEIISDIKEMDSSLKVEIEEVNNIPREPSGKKKYLKKG